MEQYITLIAIDILEYRGRFINRDYKGTGLDEFTQVVSWWVEEEGHFDISDKLIPHMFMLWNEDFRYRSWPAC